MTTRVRKQHKPGRITFVGSGPGDPGLLTTRARNVLAHAALVFTDPDVPEAVLALIGTDLPPTSGPHPADAEPAADAKTDDAAAAAPAAAPAMTFPHGVDVRPALGDPTEVAKLLIAEAKHGVDVVRLVAGDPLSVDAVITEVNALAKTAAHFEIVPGLPSSTAVPTYAGLPVGSTPLVRADRLAERLGIDGEVWVKNDAHNPTHSFKDRVVAVASARARELGMTTLACASTGNLAAPASPYRAGYREYLRSAGTPQIVLPHMYDQYYWGNQVERLNIGRAAETVTTEVLAETLQLAEEAAKVGTQIRTDGARVAAERLRRLG